MAILETIHSHKDLVVLNEAQRKALCQEIREFLVSHVSKTGGHLASNLGVVELSVAIETVYNTMEDRLVFDVGHQSYVHKLLTDRQADFLTLRTFGGMAGFPKPSESPSDAFVAGHASSSVSIALGMARARTAQGKGHHVVALLGDGAATGGLAFEGLNDAAVSGEPLVIILNDNAMSIDRNVGGMASHLSSLRTKERYLGMKKRYRNALLKIPGGKYVYRFTSAIKDRLRRMLIPTTMFESMGFSYLGPVDGHDTEHLIRLLGFARDMKCPVLVHVMTQKGKGYGPAEANPRAFHGVGKFNPETGESLKKSAISYSQVFGDTLCALAEKERRLCAITAAMPAGTGLLGFKEAYPKRLFDVGIAEEHAVSMAGGLAKEGMLPVVALYSTFLQRAYDMILQDICMLKLHAVFAIDRAGLVGEDGETHHGVFDMGMLSQAPGLRVLNPGTFRELETMLTWAVEKQSGPVAIRYPRGGQCLEETGAWKPDQPVKVYGTGEHITFITYGNLTANALKAAQLLEDSGAKTRVLRMTAVWPLPMEELKANIPTDSRVIVLEEACGGVAEKLSNALQKLGFRACYRDLGRRYIPHGTMEELYAWAGLDGESLEKFALEVWKSEN